MKINLPYFILYVFCIGFVADIILLILSKINFKYKTSFNALKPYFHHYNYLSPVLAGITSVMDYYFDEDYWNEIKTKILNFKDQILSNI